MVAKSFFFIDNIKSKIGFRGLAGTPHGGKMDDNQYENKPAFLKHSIKVMD